MKAEYTHTVCLQVYNVLMYTSACVLRSYHVRSMPVDTDLSHELMCLTKRDVYESILTITQSILPCEFILVRTRNARTVCLLVLIPSTYVLRAYNNARHRIKQRAYEPSLPGRARIPFNHNLIDIAHQIRHYEDRVCYRYTRNVCLLLYIRTYFVRNACVQYCQTQN